MDIFKTSQEEFWALEAKEFRGVPVRNININLNN
jgi:hypothetical protein